MTRSTWPGTRAGPPITDYVKRFVLQLSDNLRSKLSYLEAMQDGHWTTHWESPLR